MKQLHNLLVFSTCLFFANQLFAHPASLSKPWSGSVHFGYVANSGNSRNSSALGKLALRYQHKEKWEIGGIAKGQFNSGKKGKTAQNVNLSGDADYFFFPRHFAFVTANYNYDQFAPYLYSTIGIIGYGWHIFKTSKLTLTGKVGPGIRHQKEAVSKKTDTDVIGYVEGIFRWKFNDNVEFKQTISVESGDINTLTQSKTALITKIIGNLSMEASVAIKSYSKIPKFSKNKYKTDTVTNLALVYAF